MKIKNRFYRFLLTGILNTCFSLSVYWILVFFGLHYALAVLVSNSLGVVFNFQTTGKFVFSNKNGSLIFRFIAVYLMMYLITVVSLRFLILYVANKYTSALIVAAPMALASYYLNKKFVFGSQINVPESTSEKGYVDYLENKYSPFRYLYLRVIYFPKIIRLLGQGAVVDLGCGNGELLRFLTGKNRQSLGIDSNPFFVEYCKAKGLQALQDDITELTRLPGPVLNAVCDNVLEHLNPEDADRFFKALRPKMPRNSSLVIIVPGEKGFRSDPTHKYFITEPVLRNLCQQHGFSLSRHFYHPVNHRVAGRFLYLNMQVFKIEKT